MRDQIFILLFVTVGLLFSSCSAPEPPEGMVYFAGGQITIGSDSGALNEYPSHDVDVDPFYIDAQPVTVEEFAKFVEETGYTTQAEKFGDSGVFDVVSGRWKLLPGADWQTPFGEGGPVAKPDHPVTQVSWNDVQAYCQWAGKRLPTEKEWEYAARNGENSGNRYSWGNTLEANGEFKANVWQGQFPDSANVQDGHLYTSAVGVYGETKSGMTDMGGNVWEWTSTAYDLYEANPRTINVAPNNMVLKGGSFLCDSTVCHGYRVSARSFNSKESATVHMGFRTAKSLK